MGRWPGNLEYKQAFLGRIVDIGAELFAISACCSRAEMLRLKDPHQGRSAQKLADAFAYQSRLRIESMFSELWENTDSIDASLSAELLAGNFTWLEEGVLDPSEGTGPWIADATPGPSTCENQHRKYR